MPIDAVVRVSFQTSVYANQAVNSALVGHAQDKSGKGPFTRTGTALYQCINEPDNAVGASLAQLGQALQSHSAKIDYASITVIRHTL